MAESVIIFWTLVIVGFSDHGHPIGSVMGSHPTMEECFQQREVVMNELGPPINYQAICIMRAIEGVSS